MCNYTVCAFKTYRPGVQKLAKSETSCSKLTNLISQSANTSTVDFVFSANRTV